MNQKSFTINFFLKLFIVKNINAKKKGRIHVSFSCVQELMLHGIHFIPCVCAMHVHVPVCIHVRCMCIGMCICTRECVHGHMRVCVFIC